MSGNCERFEVLTSTFLDEGLERPLQHELIDHIARCHGCRAFYREARALDGLVAAVEPRSGLDEAPPEVWEGIRQRVLPRPATAGRKSLNWLLAAAAALLVGVSLPFVPWPEAPGVDLAGEPIEVRLEANRDAMSEARFLELTTELLQADRRFHFAMQDVMDAVIEGSWEAEGATSESDLDEASENEEENRSPRIRT